MGTPVRGCGETLGFQLLAQLAAFLACSSRKSPSAVTYYPSLNSVLRTPATHDEFMAATTLGGNS